MPDDSSSAAEGGGRWWRGLRSLFLPEQEPSLRDQIEEAIEEHEGDVGEGDDLSHAEREMLRNILHFGERTVGDIILARTVCATEAADKGVTTAEHATHLIVHGTLHLLGYDHIEEDEAEAMEDLERAALAKLGIADPYLVTES